MKMPNGSKLSSPVSDNLRRLIWFLSKDKFEIAAKELWSHPTIRREILLLMKMSIETECEQVDSLNNNSPELDIGDALKTFSMDVLEKRFPK